MNLAQQLQARVRAYVEGQATLTDVRAWLAEHAQAIADAGDAALNELDGRAWILISEYDYGHRDEVGLRTALGELAGPRGPWPRRARGGDSPAAGGLRAPASAG